MKPLYRIIVTDNETAEEVKRLEYYASRRVAERVLAGMEINMDHTKYAAEIVEIS